MKNNFITKIIGATLAFAMMIGGAVGINVAKEAKEVSATDYTKIATFDFDCDETPSNTSTGLSAASDVQTYLNACSDGLTVTVSAKSGNLYKGKGSGGGSIPQKVFKMGKASGGGAFTFTVSGSDNVSKVVVNGHVWSTTSAISVNNSDAQTFSTAQSATVHPFVFELASATKTLSIDVATSAVCVSSIELYKANGSQGPIALANPNPQYNALNRTVSWTTDENADKYQVKVDSGEYADINTETYDASGLTVGTQHTVYIKAVSENANYTSTEGSVTFTPTAPFEAKIYAQCTSVNDLEVGASYLITNGISGTVKTMSNSSASNNRPAIDVAVSNSKITSTSSILTLTLGGSSGAWTLFTENYPGTNGYLASAASGNNNYCRVISDETTGTISFNSGKAVINLGPHETRTLLRYNPNTNNNNPLFACYSSGQEDIYLWKEYKELDHLAVTGSLEKTSYYDSETFSSAGLTISAVYSDSSSRVLAANEVNWGDSLTAGMTQIRGSYTENGITKYTEYFSITVAADSLSTVSLSGAMVSQYFTSEAWNKGNLTVTATYASGGQNNVTSSATIAYFSDVSMNNAVATPADLGTGTKTVYVKATYQGVSNQTGYAQTVTITVEHGSVENDPLTADEAITKGVALAANDDETEREYYIQGVVREVTENALGEGYNNATFFLEESDQEVNFRAYRISPDSELHNYSDLVAGAEVLMRCKIKKNSGTMIQNGSTGSLLSITYTAPEQTGVALNKNSLTLKKGATATLTASALPLGAELGAVTWTSSNENVATVNQEGQVTAVEKGSATITATSSGFTATCSVQVLLAQSLDLSTNTSTSASATEVDWKIGNVATMVLDKNTSSTAANNYLANSDPHTRMYQNQKLTLVSISDANITKIEFVATSSSYANALKNSTFTNASATISSEDDKIVVVTPTNSSNPVVVTISAATRLTKVDVFYNQSAAETIEGLSTRSTLSFHYVAHDDGTYTYSDVAIRFGALMKQEIWNRLDTESGSKIDGYGVLVSDETVIGNTNLKDHYNEANGTTIRDFFMPKATKATPTAASDAQKSDAGVEGDYYIWNRYHTISTDDLTKTFVAVAYIKVDGQIIFMQEERASVKGLAYDLIYNQGVAENTANGSLKNLADLVVA